MTVPKLPIGLLALAVAAVLTGLVPVAAPSAAAQAPDTIEVGDASLAGEPQLAVEGILVVTIIDSDPRPRKEYRVSMPTGEGIKITAAFASGVTTGGAFVGNLAVPAAVVARAEERFAARIGRSAQTPLEVGTEAGANVLELVEQAPEPLAVVRATIDIPVAAAVAAKAHTLDIAIVGGLAFSDAQVTDFVARLNGYWPGQSTGIIASVSRPLAIQRYSAAGIAPCDTDALWNQAAGKFGRSTFDYWSGGTARHLVVLSGAACGFTGQATLSGGVHEGGTIWANPEIATLAHEFGHNLGLDHSNVHSCDGPTLVEGSQAQGCYDEEYGDYYDIMGGGFTWCVNAVCTSNGNDLTALNVTHKKTLGFLPTASIARLTATGNRSLVPAAASSGLRALEVVDQITGDTYLVEYRSGTGIDSGAFYSVAPEQAGLGVGVRVLKQRTPPPDYFQSLTSVVFKAPLAPGNSVRHVSMGAGQTFATPSGGLSITVAALSASAASIDVKIAPLPATIDRISGTDRYSTAIAISRAGFPATAPVVYVAQGGNYPDALAAAPAAVRQGGPLLLTPSDTLLGNVKQRIIELTPSRIVVVGGEAAVSRAVFSELQTIAPTQRIGGTDRFDTGRKIVASAFPTAPMAYIATAFGYPDALSASAAGGALGVPVVLVDGTRTSLDDGTRALLIKLGVTTTRIAGGTSAVSAGIEKSLASFTTVSRSAGVDRFSTSQRINAVAFPSLSRVFLATGYQFPDALAGAALAGAKGSPLYVIPTTCVPAATRSDIITKGASHVTLLGGTAALANSVLGLPRC